MTWRRVRDVVGIIARDLIGIVAMWGFVQIVVFGVERITLFQPVVRWASDLSMWMQAELSFGHNKNIELGFVDMDDESARPHLGLGGTTDRAELKKVIDKVASQKPKALVLDIDFSQPGTNTSDLRSYLLNEYDNPSKHAAGPAPLVLVRTYRPHLKMDRKRIQTIGRTEGGHPIEVVEAFRDDGAKGEEVRTYEGDGGTIYDVLTSGKKWAHLASSGFLSTRDSDVTSAIIAEPVCDDEKIHGVPSVELLTLAILADKTEQVEGDVRQAFNGDCGNNLRDGVGLIDKDHISLSLEPTPGHSVPINLADRNIGLIAYSLFPSQNGSGDGRLKIISACRLLDECPSPDGGVPESPNAQAPPTADFMKDRIVVIGGYAEQDKYSTALGKMPGGLLLLNAIESLYEDGQVIRAPRLLVLAIEFGFGLMIWFLADRLLRHNVGMALALILLVVVTAGLGLVLLRNGLLLSIGPPLIGFFAHPLGDSLWHLLKDIKDEGWRALLHHEQQQARHALRNNPSRPAHTGEEEEESTAHGTL